MKTIIMIIIGVMLALTKSAFADQGTAWQGCERRGGFFDPTKAKCHLPPKQLPTNPPTKTPRPVPPRRPGR